MLDNASKAYRVANSKAQAPLEMSSMSAVGNSSNYQVEGGAEGEGHMLPTGAVHAFDDGLNALLCMFLSLPSQVTRKRMIL